MAVEYFEISWGDEIEGPKQAISETEKSYLVQNRFGFKGDKPSRIMKSALHFKTYSDALNFAISRKRERIESLKRQINDCNSQLHQLMKLQSERQP